MRLPETALPASLNKGVEDETEEYEQRDARPRAFARSGANPTMAPLMKMPNDMTMAPVGVGVTTRFIKKMRTRAKSMKRKLRRNNPVDSSK
jgi:hypothetical protein